MTSPPHTRHHISSRPYPPHSLLCSFPKAPPTAAPYTLSLHDALPISALQSRRNLLRESPASRGRAPACLRRDRKSTRLSSHVSISYAVFCLKKKKRKRVRSTRHDH